MAKEAGGYDPLVVVGSSSVSDEAVRTACPADTERSWNRPVDVAPLRESARSNEESESAEGTRHALEAPDERSPVAGHTRAPAAGHFDGTVFQPKSGRLAGDVAVRLEAKQRYPTPPARSLIASSV